MAGAPLLGLFGRDYARRHVDLVTNQHKRKPAPLPHIRIVHELIQPPLQVLEAAGLTHIKGQQTAVCAAVERRAQALESLWCVGTKISAMIR